MEFKTYDKVHRLGKEETEGILDGGTIYVQEKVDGANTQIWVKEDGTLGKGSRNQEVTNKEFNGFCQYVDSHEGIKNLLKDNPTWRLYGEWLVRHTIGYKETAYKKFYLFDIEVDGMFMNAEEVKHIAEQYEIETVPLLKTYTCPLTDEQWKEVQEFVGKSQFGDKGEGVVIKNMEFINKFGVRCNAKIVTPEFKEDNAITFGGNDRHNENYNEIYVMNKYMTLERVRKIMHKVEPMIEGKLDMKDIPRITHTAYHDMITEEMWEIIKDVPTLNFRTLQGLCLKKARQIFVELLTGDISVAHK